MEENKTEKETTKEGIEKEAEKQEPSLTDEEIKANEELLKANAQIVKLQKEQDKLQEEIRKKDEAAKESAFKDLLAKNKVKPEFHEFVKYKLQWQDVTNLDSAFEEFIKDNPALVVSITTGGTIEETIKGDEPDTKNNPLLDYKNENFL